MRRFGIICLLIFMLCLSTRALTYLAVKMDSQLQNEERINYTSVIDSETVEAATANNVSVDSYISTELNIGWLVFFSTFGILAFVISLKP